MGTTKEQLLEVLKEMEDYRKQIASGELQGDGQHCIRLCQAGVARLAGYNDRNDWIAAIKQL